MAETYYKDFIYPLEKEKNWGYFDFSDDDIDSSFIQKEIIIKQSTFGHSADSALKYFYKLWNSSENLREIIYYPIRQLECYLNILEDGATWTLEKKMPNQFKAHNTNFPSKEISEVCLYLLNLTNIKVKDNDKY